MGASDLVLVGPGERPIADDLLAAHVQPVDAMRRRENEPGDRIGGSSELEPIRPPDGEIGSLEPGKRADLAVWRTDGLELGGASDPVAGLVLSAPHRVDRLYVGGREVVRDGALVRADEDEIARAHRVQARRFA